MRFEQKFVRTAWNSAARIEEVERRRQPKTDES
jgi:hypothetical protein